MEKNYFIKKPNEQPSSIRLMSMENIFLEAKKLNSNLDFNFKIIELIQEDGKEPEFKEVKINLVATYI